MVDRVVSVRFTADPSAYVAGINRMQAANKGFKAGSDQAGNGISQFAKKALAVVGVGAAVKSTTAVFAGFQQSLNQLQAVGGATGAQMDQVTTKARELGKSIAGVSSQDAVDAMLELAKGGLTVDQAMQAATGTLNLAAAAQVSAGQAAGIQSAALNTFGLAANQAGRVADVLANTANAASGEITDFAQGLAQTGLPAKALGISIEDTSTALAAFAKNGLNGSDAGTSLKTMLISLTNPTEKAQGALDTLGVTAFDAQGNFVGLEAISGQLAAAQKNMSVEAFNAAAATAFGTDAIRGATAFAAVGADGFANLGTQIGKAGGAQLMATANTKGLAGALDSVKAAVQDTQIALMQDLSPALETTTRQLAAMIPQVAAALVPSLTTAGTAVLSVAQQALPLLISAAEAVAPAFTIAGNAISFIIPILQPLISGVGAVLGVFADLPGPLQAAALGLAAIFLLNRKMTGFVNGLRASGAQMSVFQRQVAYLQSRGVGGISAFTQVAGRRLSTLSGNFRAAAASAYATGGAMRVAGVGVRAFGTAAASAGRSLTAAFGGPIGLAIVGITAAMAIFSSRSAEADARTQDLKASVAGLDGELTKVSGKFDVLGKAQLAQSLATSEDAFRTLGTSSSEAAEALSAGGSVLAEYKARILGSTTAIAGWGQNAVGASSKASEAVTTFNTVLGEVETKSRTAQDGFRSLVSVVAKGLPNTNLSELIVAFQKAEVSGRSVQDVFKDLGITGPAADTAIAQLKSDTFAAGDGMLYFSKSAADAADRAAGVGDAAATTAPKVEKAASAADRWAAAYAAAEAPTRNFQSALDDTKAAADSVQTAVDLMAGALLRAAGVDLTAEQAQRENAAAYRGVTEGILAKRRATEDLARAQQDQKKAESDLKTLQSEGRKKDDEGQYTETSIEFAQRQADAERGVADAKRAVADAGLKNQASLDDDAEGYEKAAQAAASFASQAALTALANGDVNSAAKAGQAALAGQRKAFIDAAVAAGKSKAEAEKAADQYLATPKEVTTAFRALVDQAKANGTSLFRVYDKTTGKFTAAFLTEGEAVAQAKAGATLQRYQAATGTFSATLSATEDGKLDSYITKANSLDGRVIRMTIRTDTSGNTSFNTGGSANTGSYTGGLLSETIRGFASGGQFSGLIPGSPPANKRKDNILAMLPNGMPVGVRSREFVVNEDSTEKNLAALRFINAGGKIPGFAGGGQFSGAGLAGIGERAMGERESRVVEQLQRIVDALQDVRDSNKQLGAAAAEANAQLRTSLNSQRVVNTEQRGKVSQARTSAAEKLSAAERARDRIAGSQSDSLTAARKRLTDAEDRQTKTAAQRAAKAKAISDAEAALQRASNGQSRALAAAEERVTKARRDGERAITRAVAGQTKANSAAAQKVAQDRAAANSANAASTAEKTRLATLERVLAREKALRAKQVELAARYDKYATKVEEDQQRITDLQAQRAQYKQDGRETALGVRGGIFGSDNFEGKSITTADLKAQLRSSISGARDYDSIVARAAKNGVSDSILEKLKGDVDGRGGMILRALATGTAKDAKEISSLYRELGNVGERTGGRFSAAAGLDKQLLQAQNQLSTDKSMVAQLGAALKQNGALVAATVAGVLNGKEVTVNIDGKVYRGQAELVVNDVFKQLGAAKNARGKKR